MCGSMSEFVHDYESIILIVIYRILMINNQDIYHCISVYSCYVHHLNIII